MYRSEFVTLDLESQQFPMAIIYLIDYFIYKSLISSDKQLT
mgnify:CR=1 FL=1